MGGMDAGDEGRRSFRVLVSLASLVIIVAGLKSAAPIVTVLLISVFFATVAAPAVLWLKGRGIPSGFAALLVVLAVIAMLTGFGALLGTSINGFVRALPGYRVQLDDEMTTAITWLSGHGVDLSLLKLTQLADPGSIMQVASNIFTAIGGMLGNSFVILLIIVFILLEVPDFAAKIRAAFPGSPSAMGRMDLITANVFHYLGLKTLVSLLTGLAAGVLVAAVGVNFPLLWGLLAFLLNYIPTFGSIIASILPILLALVQFGGGAALVVAIGYLVINFLVGNVLEPRLMGKSMGLSTLVVFLSLLAWGYILGTAGMFFAVPLTMACKIALESDPETRWLAILMGPCVEVTREADAPEE